MRTTFAVIAFAAAAGACAGDNPDNVPQYGNWEMVTQIDSLSVDGQIIPRENHPPAFGALEGAENRCGEPLFINREWQQDDINRRVNGECTLDQYDVTPVSVTGSGTCTGIAADARFDPDFSLRISQSRDSYRMVLTMEGSAEISGAPGQHYIKAIAVQEGTRTGDC